MMNWKNLSGLYGFQFVNMVLPLVTVPILTRNLGLEQFGILSWVFATTFIVVLLTDSGINSVAITRIARHAKSPRKVEQAFSAAQYLRALIALLFSLVLLLCVWLTPAWSKHFSLFLIALLNVLGTLLFPVYVFVALEKSNITALLQLLGRSVSVVLTLTLIKSPNDLPFALLLQSSATLISGLIAHFSGARFGIPNYVAVGKRAMQVFARKASALWWPEFQSHAMVSAPIMLLGSMGNYAQTGAYAVADKIARAGASLLMPISQALLPKLSASKIGVANGSTHAKHANTLGSAIEIYWLKKIALLALAASVVLFFLGEYMFNAIVGFKNNALSAPNLVISFLSVWLFCNAMVRSTEHLVYFAAQRYQQYWRSVRFLLPLQWLLLFALTLPFYAAGTAAALAAFELLLLIVLLFQAKQRKWI